MILMNTIQSVNPTNQEIIGETPITSQTELQHIVAKSKKAFQSWKNTSMDERASYARKLIDLLNQKKDEIALLTTREMGKPLHEAREDIEFEVEFIRWYADNVEKALGETVVKEDASAIYKTVYEPWGVCASIAPWNFPITMASTGITAQLLAGNTVIFKPSENSTLSQKLFVDLFNQTGLPEGVLQCVIGAGDVGAALVDSDIDLVWFTGSTAVGQQIYKKCAEKFIKPLLELGGSSPAVVFADCDLEKTVATIKSARYFNSGQVCSSVKRVYVEKSLFDQFVAALAKTIQNPRIGNPEGDVEFGPLVTKKQLELLVSQVDDAVQKGARIVVGGMKPTDSSLANGNFYLPTLLTGVTSDMRVLTEEVFGPVLPIIPFESESEAIDFANATPYGLTAEVFTKDIEKANRVASRIQAGGVSINMDISYNPDSPIGGFKKSGLGREYGIEGFRELAQLKYICVAK